MIKNIFVLAVLVSLFGCDGGDGDSEPVSIIGDWYVEFERNGDIGESHLVISENNVDSYEIGSGLIMDEWHSGLDVDKLYRFSVDGFDSSYTIEGNRIIVQSTEDDLSTARIVEMPEEIEVYSWEIGTSGVPEQTYVYRLEKDSLIFAADSGEELRYFRGRN